MVTTERKDHCRTFLEEHSGTELARFDGIVAVGGDGLFQEVLNAVLTLRRGPLFSRGPAPDQASWRPTAQLAVGKTCLSSIAVSIWMHTSRAASR